MQFRGSNMNFSAYLENKSSATGEVIYQHCFSLEIITKLVTSVSALPVLIMLCPRNHLH